MELLKPLQSVEIFLDRVSAYNGGDEPWLGAHGSRTVAGAMPAARALAAGRALGWRSGLAWVRQSLHVCADARS